MAELTPAQPTPWDIIEEECKARGFTESDEPYWTTNAEFVQRAKTATLTDDDCKQLGLAFGSINLWRNLNKSAAAWIAEHEEAA